MGMSDPQAKSCLAPVVDERIRLLVCGSLPGEASLRASRYYAHPQNQFWRLMELAFGEPLASLDYPERLDLLLRRGLGLWDTVASARRTGSLDSAIRDIAPTGLASLAATLPELRAVGFNGATAARLGRRALGESGLALIDLPSSSPALTMDFALKAERWAELAKWLD